jgi:DNA repair photolyase
LRPANPEAIKKKLFNGHRNKNPKSSLAFALRLKKTLRVGNRSDPYQPAEKKYKITRQVLYTLIRQKWSFAIQTRFLNNLLRDEDYLYDAHAKGLLTLIPVISPGGSSDWAVLERKRTAPIYERIKILRKWVKRGWNIGVNGEPFIPGYHTFVQFRDMLKKLKDIGIKSYNTYNLHLNDHVFKNLMKIGLDVNKIADMNQDKYWTHIQKELCSIAEEEGMVLGCPDFVNTAKDWREKTNTCCGVDVPNPSRFTTHLWKKLLQDGKKHGEVFRMTWEGIGDKEVGRKIIEGKKTKEFYTMNTKQKDSLGIF